MRGPSRQLVDLLAACSPDVRRLAMALRELVLTEAPEAEEVLYSVFAEVIVFQLPGRRMRAAFCNVAAYGHHVNLVWLPHGQLRVRSRTDRMMSPPIGNPTASRGRRISTI